MVLDMLCDVAGNEASNVSLLQAGICLAGITLFGILSITPISLGFEDDNGYNPKQNIIYNINFVGYNPK